MGWDRQVFHRCGCSRQVGVQHKTSEVRARSANLMRVNVYKDKVTTASTPQLPQYKELVSTLEPHYSNLTAEYNSAKRRPVFDYSDTQEKERGAEGFLAVLRYLESLCMDLRAHTITNVQSNDDKVPLLLKESFMDSVVHDHPFMKLFAETQQFSVYIDEVLSNYEWLKEKKRTVVDSKSLYDNSKYQRSFHHKPFRRVAAQST